MNFLAHSYLSGTNNKTLAGNFFGDFVKGNQLENYDLKIQHGILLHREIDHFTDNHPIVLQSKKRLRKRYRHYAPVVTDVFYDHFLATNWNSFHHLPLINFTKKTYGILNEYVDLFPDRAQHMFSYMKRDNWLYHYKFVEGIDKALTGMARRTKFDSKMEHSAEDLRNYYNDFENDFHLFFPEIKKHCVQYLNAL